MSYAPLMAEYLQENPTWYDMLQAIDALWLDLGIAQSIKQLTKARQPIDLATLASDTTLLDTTNIKTQDRDTLIMIASSLGFNFAESSILEDQDYVRICRHIGDYFLNDTQGVYWLDFLGWCLNTRFSMERLWTQDYKTFVTKSEIGTPVYKGGTWFPTNQIKVYYDLAKFNGVSAKTVYDFLNQFSSVNTVLLTTQVQSQDVLTLEYVVYGDIKISY